MEIWKDIPGYENIYQASTYGRIRTKEGKVTYSTLHGERHWQQRILKQKETKDKCRRVTLWKDKESKDYLVYRLVALTFLGAPPNEEYTVNHKDGDRGNNHIENLLCKIDHLADEKRQQLYEKIGQVAERLPDPKKEEEYVNAIWKIAKEFE